MATSFEFVWNDLPSGVETNSEMATLFAAFFFDFADGRRGSVNELPSQFAWVPGVAPSRRHGDCEVFAEVGSNWFWFYE